MQPHITNTGTRGVPKRAKAWDVVKAFWNGIKPWAMPFGVILIAVAASGVLQVYVPIFYKQFFDVISVATDKTAAGPTLVSIVVTILILNAIIWLLIRGATFLQNIYQAKAIARLKQIAFDYMYEHSYSFFANNFTGSLTQRINRFARAFDTLADQVIWTIVPLSVNVIGIMIVLWQVKPLISMVVLVWVIILFVFNYFFSIWKVKYDIKTALLDSKATGALSDSVTNQNTAQLFNGYHFETKNYTEVTNEQAQAQAVGWNLSAIIDSVQGILTVLVEFFLFYISIRYWQMGIFSIGTFVLINAYLIGLGGRLWNFSRLIRSVYEGFADAKEMLDIMMLPHEIMDLPNAKPLVVSKGIIELKNVGFSFNESRTVLNNISLSIGSGEKIALVGPSGAGKSTFVRLLLRFYDTASGSILIDGQEIKQVTQASLREAISFVPQDPILFHRTLRENIRYGRRSATDDEVLEAAKLAHCDEFIQELPAGYDTYVGERGIKLSGGERQRVAIARALLKNAPILILDEATSSLDSHSESLIQDALDTLMKGRTTIVIAHRLSTIRKMDRIIVIDAGQVKEEGTHDELLKVEGGLYKKLWQLQAGGFLKEEDETVVESE